MKVRDPVFGEEEWVPHSCACQCKCWLIVKSKRRVGRCPYGGPYLGYVEIPDERDSGTDA